MLQKSGDHWRPLGFFSGKLTDTESRYSTFDRDIGCPCSHQTFPPFLRRSSISTLDRSQTTCHCHFSCFSPHFTQTTSQFGIHFRVQRANFVIARFEKCRCQFFVPPKQNNHWISRCHSGGRSSGFQRDGRRAKPLPRNAAFAKRHIPQIGFPPNRHSTPGWRCFHRQFSPNCPTQIQKKHF